MRARIDDHERHAEDRPQRQWFRDVKTEIFSPRRGASRRRGYRLYREEPDPSAPPPPPQKAPGKAVWSHAVTPDE